MLNVHDVLFLFYCIFLFAVIGDSQNFSSQASALSHSDWETENMTSRDRFNNAMAILSNKTFPKLNHQLKMQWENVSKPSKALMPLSF